MNTHIVRLPMATLLSTALLLLAACGHGPDPTVDKESARKTPSAKTWTGAVTHGGEFQDAERISSGSPQEAAKKPQKKAEKEPSPTQPGAKIARVAKNVYLEIDGDKRRVLLNAEVCLRRGMLEQLLCNSGTKEHESILSADIDAKDVHMALLAAGAEAGSPFRLVPQYTLENGVLNAVTIQNRKPVVYGYSVYPAQGTAIKISLQFEEKGRTQTVSAQQWLKNIQTEKELAVNWVFGGSVFYSDSDPKEGKPLRYGANDGNVICVSNFETAMLDLPIESSSKGELQEFEAWTDRIPALETLVVVVLEPIQAANKK